MDESNDDNNHKKEIGRVVPVYSNARKQDTSTKYRKNIVSLSTWLRDMEKCVISDRKQDEVVNQFCVISMMSLARSLTHLLIQTHI